MSKKKHIKFGTSPGSLVYVGPKVTHSTKLTLIEYNADYQTEKPIKQLQNCDISAAKPHVAWLDVNGIHEPKVIEKIGEMHKIHPLVLEDIMNTQQKPKIEFYNDSYAFVSLKMLHLDPTQLEMEAEHVSFILSENFLISFQEERTSNIFEPILERIRTSAGKTRTSGPDYLLFSLIDLVVDHYLEVLEDVNERLEVLEQHILEGKHKDPISELYRLKRQLTLMRKYVWPLRDLLNHGLRENNKLIKKSSYPYFRDVYDHITQVIETIDAEREILTGLMDIHYSTLTNRMNSVMKTLTIYSAIFMPLTFIVGIYGMNFNNMPELRHPNGYFFSLAGMFILAMGLLFYFRRRRWL